MILIADNLQITNSTINDAIDGMRADPVRKLVKQCQAAGAHMIDINAGPLTKDGGSKMAFLVQTIQEVCGLPLVLDTANPLAIEAGLKVGKNKMIINGFSLEPHKLEHILPLAVKYDTDIIGYLLNPSGHVPPDASKRLNVAVELLSECQKAGLDQKHLIIDPIIAPVIWQDGKRHAMEILETIRNLPEVLGFGVRTVAGLSNLTAGSRGNPRRLLLERAYLPMLAASGLDMVLLNMLRAESIKMAGACSALTSEKPFAWDEL
jgi:5-methyltetrahydrofolate corrinoid/iron sulfur protein methyltransferase